MIHPARGIFRTGARVAMAGLAALQSLAAEATLRLPDMPLHDPFIVADSATKTYYLYTSNIPRLTGVQGIGTMAYKSKDLTRWEAPKNVFLVPPDSFATQGGWAPEVHLHKGMYYLFTTVHNEGKSLGGISGTGGSTYVRGTIAAVSDSLEGPFRMLDSKSAVPPADFMTLDGTLYQDKNGKPWMVYAHEWLQKIDGTIEAIPLREDLSAPSGPPVHLFKGSDAPWLNASIKADARPLNYVTDGPQFYRTKDDHLLMLWSSYESGSYVQTIARSESGDLAGPWEQLAPLVKKDSGHGMLFHTFEGQLMMVLHRPFKNARGKLYEMADKGDRLEIVRQRVDLDGDTDPTHPATNPAR